LLDPYVAAAVRLRQLGYLSPEAVDRVAESAQKDFQKLKFPTEAMRAARQAELNADLELAMKEA
jgi:hypothetical protein